MSTYVLDQVNADLQARGISVDWVKYIRNLTTERRRSQFWLRVRDHDAEMAAVVANLWAEKAYATLVEFHQHAINAKILSEYLAGMSTCPEMPEIEPSDNQNPLPPSLCGRGSPDEIQQAIAEVTAQTETEITASNAISPALTFSLGRKASVPVTPVAYRSSLLLLTGALLGVRGGDRRGEWMQWMDDRDVALMRFKPPGDFYRCKPAIL